MCDQGTRAGFDLLNFLGGYYSGARILNSWRACCWIHPFLLICISSKNCSKQFREIGCLQWLIFWLGGRKERLWTPKDLRECTSGPWNRDRPRCRASSTWSASTRPHPASSEQDRRSDIGFEEPNLSSFSWLWYYSLQMLDCRKIQQTGREKEALLLTFYYCDFLAMVSFSLCIILVGVQVYCPTSGF